MSDGGPAFPLDNWHRTAWPKGAPANFGTGMTLRQYYAGQAVIGILSNAAPAIIGKDFVIDAEELAKAALHIADAVIAADSAQGSAAETVAAPSAQPAKKEEAKPAPISTPEPAVTEKGKK